MNKDVKGSLTWAGAILAVTLAAVAAKNLGYIDGDATKRLVIGLNGLMIAWMGNRIPKTFAPSAVARRAQRVAAWSLVLSGLVYAGVWAFAPIQTAVWVGCGAVIAGIVVTFGYCLSLRNRAKAA